MKIDIYYIFSAQIYSTSTPRTGIYERLLPSIARNFKIGAPFLTLLLKAIQGTVYLINMRKLKNWQNR